MVQLGIGEKGKWALYPNPFWHKSKFDPSKSDAAIGLYLSHIGGKLLSCTKIKHFFCNLTREEQQAMYNLKSD